MIEFLKCHVARAFKLKFKYHDIKIMRYPVIDAMKKIVIALLLFISACQPATPTPVAATPAPTETPSPSPVPPTGTPSPTPTLAPTATPFPMYFTDEFNSLSAAWTTLQAGSDATPNITTENSRLSIQTDAPYAWVYSLYGPQEYGDVRIDTKFVNNALSPASAGLICRYNETDGWLEYNVTSDGGYNLLYGKWLASGVADYLPIVDGVLECRPAKRSGTADRASLQRDDCFIINQRYDHPQRGCKPL